MIFDIRGESCVLGDGMKVSDAIGDHPSVTNDTLYDLALPELCLIKQSGTSLISAPYQGNNYFDDTRTHGYCVNI